MQRRSRRLGKNIDNLYCFIDVMHFLWVFSYLRIHRGIISIGEKLCQEGHCFQKVW